MPVQIVIGDAAADEVGLVQNLPQLAGRQAGTDDRAVQVFGQLPDLVPSGGGRIFEVGRLPDQNRGRCDRERESGVAGSQFHSERSRGQARCRSHERQIPNR